MGQAVLSNCRRFEIVSVGPYPNCQCTCDNTLVADYVSVGVFADKDHLPGNADHGCRSVAAAAAYLDAERGVLLHASLVPRKR